ncbi:hypothetical protein M011DRAFT_482299 [Sporormia fimetaria CBS 119925]|uniref:Uncharacterized protein n=1 Tax=Sporormia fimetaria CBS 119925 TaxID=1340428 RepID=A0A6A6UVC8_9PLEO|nr:hypothetical protein M011DRAFT_482299 [Sporormia fimetaria CBS 119925]
MREVLVMVGKKIRSGLQDDDEAFRLGKESLRKLGFSFNEEHGAIGYSVPTSAVKGLPLNCPSFTIIHGWSDVHVPLLPALQMDIPYANMESKRWPYQPFVPFELAKQS